MVRRIGFASSRSVRRRVRRVTRRRPIVRAPFIRRRKSIHRRRLRVRRSRGAKRRIHGRRRKLRRSTKGSMKGESFSSLFSTSPFIAPRGGIVAADCVPIPYPVNYSGPSGFGLSPAGMVAETPLSKVLGSYTFDFSRFANMAFGVGTSTPWIQNFKELRFGRGRMTLRRIDNGNTTHIMASATAGAEPALVSVIPYNYGVSPVSIKLHYLRLPADENASLYQNDNEDGYVRFMSNKARKTRVLRQGRTISFSFLPTSHTKRYLSSFSRYPIADAPFTSENDYMREVALPSRGKRLGWIPAAIPCLIQNGGNLTNPDVADGTGGLGPSRFRIYGSTLIFMFEIDQVGPITDSITTPAGVVNIGTSGLQFPIVFRTESCRVSFRGIVRNRTNQVSYAPTCVAYPFASDEYVALHQKTVLPSLSGNSYWNPVGGTFTAGENPFNTTPQFIGAQEVNPPPLVGVP